jgi:uncharacterized protein YbaR (Trm112 family)
VFLQPFSDEVTDDLFIEFTCTKCKEKVISRPKVQASLNSGGVGHKCDNCDTYLAIICCPSCRATLTVDDEEWEVLASAKGSECPACGAFLFRKKWDTGANMVSSGILCPGLSNWSTAEVESAYLSRVRPKLKDINRNLFSILHHSVGTRMKSAKESLEYLLKNEWYSPMVMSNISSSIKESVQYKTPHDLDFHQNIFSFINNLRSALDMLSQELCFHLSPTTPEAAIELYNVDQYLGNETAIKELIVKFREDESFLYLNKLRNLMQHRRLPLMVTVGAYNTDELDTIRPKNIRSLANIKLPENLDYFDDSQRNNSFTVPLISTMQRIYKVTENFVLEIYKNINP